MTRNNTRKTAAKKAAASPATDAPRAPRATPKTCAYPDGNKAVAVRETPRGPRYLCEAHAASQRRIGVTVEDL